MVGGLPEYDIAGNGNTPAPLAGDNLFTVSASVLARRLDPAPACLPRDGRARRRGSRTLCQSSAIDRREALLPAGVPQGV